MTEWHWETVTPPMRAIMQLVGQSDLSARFYLARGTALALHLGHRRSKAFFREQAVMLSRAWLR